MRGLRFPIRRHLEPYIAISRLMYRRQQFLEDEPCLSHPTRSKPTPSCSECSANTPFTQWITTETQYSGEVYCNFIGGGLAGCFAFPTSTLLGCFVPFTFFLNGSYIFRVNGEHDSMQKGIFYLFDHLGIYVLQDFFLIYDTILF